MAKHLINNLSLSLICCTTLMLLSTEIAFAMLKKTATSTRTSPVEEARRQYEESQIKLSSSSKPSSSKLPEASEKDSAKKSPLPTEQPLSKLPIAQDNAPEQRLDQRMLTTQKVLRPGMKESDTVKEPQTWWQRAQQASSEVGKKLDESKLYQIGVKQREKKDAKASIAAEREDKITSLKEQSKRSVSREEKATIEKDLKAERSKRSLQDRLQQSTVSAKVSVLGRGIDKHETTLKYGVGGAALVGGATAIAGAIAVGIGGAAIARSEVMQSPASSSATKSSSGETFEEVPFSSPTE